LAVTDTCGGVISGYWAMGNADIATKPTITVMIAMTMATIGLRTKNSAMT
jgi:hypothetical protein